MSEFQITFPQVAKIYPPQGGFIIKSTDYVFAVYSIISITLSAINAPDSDQVCPDLVPIIKGITFNEYTHLGCKPR
ncbi:hypothetical protein NIES2100_04150 [Calothrix sp. NIES-2100]|nr:hypothetical protein NIES2100_04150 [Calothrix sp. NIES-2100]